MSTFESMLPAPLKKIAVTCFGMAIAMLFFFSATAAAQDSSSTRCTDISRIIMAKEIRSEISTAFINKNELAETVYPELRFTPGAIHPGTVPDKFVTQKALVRFTVCNTSGSSTGIYFFPGFYFQGIRLYRSDGKALAALTDSLPSIREKAGYRYFEIAPRDSMVIVAELQFLRTYVNKIRPRLISPAYLSVYVGQMHEISKDSDLLTYVFCGLLLMLILYSLSVYFQAAYKEFLYYSGYAFFIGLLLFSKAYFNYHTEPVNFFLEGYLDFILQCTGILFYMIFMQKFLSTREQYPFLHKFYNAGVLLLLIAMAAYSFLHFGTDNYPLENLVENVTKMMLLVMIIIFLGYSLRQWKDKLLRYLFWGNLVYLLFSLVSFGLILAPQLFPVSGLAANSLIYYEAGLFFELVFFLAGLNYKNNKRIIAQTREREMLKAQNLLQEYEKELAVYKAQQEERERISADMHDELGSGMTAIRLMSEIARNKMKEHTPVEIEKISRSADDVLNKMNAIIWSMNSSNDTLDNLVSYIRSWSQEYFENTPVTCRVSTPENIPDMEITGDKRRNIFLCVKETLNNVLKHAGASAVQIDIQTGEKLVIRIADNGKGINMVTLRQFGNGLKNMAKRMESIGGHFEILNSNGTLTILRLPL